MSLRLKAIADSLHRPQVKVQPPAGRISEYFGSNVFDKETMSQALSGDVYKEIVRTIDKGAKMDASTAEAVASAMKTWALAKGATHYTHWFQPLTGATAEKHDSFFEPGTDGKHLEKFKGSALVQQEPDASSFPNGGIRNTFEARGYTAWDPSSPAFIMDAGATKTLCIPTVFVSYTGEALDYKTPLLKALLAVDKAATAICQEYFDKNVVQVKASLGIEQEYFLVDRALWRTRPDLMLSGRTVVGHAPAKGQQLDDHYFGSIPTLVQNYMLDLEQEAHKLGIPLRTRHNEVAPRQFECAPQFEEVNLAVDHNQLLMDLMDRVAERHHLKVLLHEKPFAGVNGSGKHNNWSLITNTGKNLLAPTSKAKENLQFLIFFVNTIKAVHEYNDLLRASIATSGNDFRLGANEAPPAIMSVFIGTQLTDVLDTLEKSGDVIIEKGDNMYMKLGLNKIPPILLDNTDRNRTSPFAFTGNKFELRAVGSSANSASPMIVLNAIVAEQLRLFKQEVDGLIGSGDKKEIAIINVLRRYVKESKAIRFEGNGYGDAWVAEAEKRGLSNVKNTPEALDAYLTKKSKKVFTDTKIFSEVELEARQEIRLENYVRKVQIESRILGDLCLNHIIPAALRYQGELVQSLKGMKDIGLKIEDSIAYETVLEISEHLSVVKGKVNEMTEARKVANKLSHMRDMAIAYKDVKVDFFDKIRYHVDKLELLVDDTCWPLAKYRELLF